MKQETGRDTISRPALFFITSKNGERRNERSDYSEFMSRFFMLRKIAEPHLLTKYFLPFLQKLSTQWVFL